MNTSSPQALIPLLEINQPKEIPTTNQYHYRRRENKHHPNQEEPPQMPFTSEFWGMSFIAPPGRDLACELLLRCVHSKEDMRQSRERIVYHRMVNEWNRLREEFPNWTPILTGYGNSPDGDDRMFNFCVFFHTKVILNLRGAKLNNSCLKGARLVAADLSGAQINNADLSNARLDNANLSGAFFTGSNLKGAQLGKANLKNTHFNNTDLSGAKLAEADLRNAMAWQVNLCHANLRSADLSNANLIDANLSDACLLYANLSGANLQTADFYRADLRNADLSGADLSYAVFHRFSGLQARLDTARQALKLLNFRSSTRLRHVPINLTSVNFSNATLSSVHYNSLHLVGKCEGIRTAGAFGNAILKRDLKDQDFIDTLYSKWEGTLYIIFWHLWKLTDFGRGLFRVAFTAFTIAILFGFLYQQYPHLITDPQCPSNIQDLWLTPFYYSIVTYTTLGFGDITPQTNWGMFWVTLEVVLGYLTLGLLISILANKVARRAS